MMRKTILSLLLALPVGCTAQELTLDGCRQAAHDNYPAIKQYRMVESMRDFNVSNAAKGWLPQVSVSAGGYAFTDIISGSGQTGLDMKNLVANGAVTLRQNIYDGGRIAAAKQLSKAQADVQQRQLDVSMHEVGERVEQLFFGILTLDEQLRQNQLLQDDLKLSANTVGSLMRSGMANQSDLDAVSVEQAKAEQQADGLFDMRQAYLQMLCTFTGRPFSETITLQKPGMTLPGSKDTWGLNRPEMGFYNAQNSLLDAQRKQLDSRLRPTVGLTGMGMVHTSVSDFVNNGLLLGGISLSWNIGALYTRKNDLHKLDLQRQQNESLRETFLFNNRLQNEHEDGNISSLRRQIEKDGKIVTLRERIRQTTERKVTMGTETVNELLRCINAASMARQQQSLHELQLLQAMYHRETINN